MSGTQGNQHRREEHHARDTSYFHPNTYNRPQRPSYNQATDYAHPSSNGHRPQLPPPPPPFRALAAYGQDERKMPANFMLNEFQEPTVEKLEKTSVAKRQEDLLRKAQKEVEKLKRKLEETSEYSIKKVCLDSGSSDDVDFFPAASAPSKNVEGDSQGKRKRRREKRKKHKKNKNRHGSSPSDGESSASSSSSHSRERCKDKKKKHKSSKKKKKRSDSPRQPTAGPSGAPVVGMFHVSVNPWSLLKERDYAYKNTHFVLDERSDPQNLNFDEMYKHHKAGHKTLSHALSSTFNLLQLEVPKEAVASDKCRFFSRDNMKRWNKQQAERVFRTEEHVGVVGVSRIPLSATPMPVDEIAKMKMVVSQDRLSTIDLEVYDNLKASTQMSFEESDLDGRHELLKARCQDQNTYRDVNSWIDFANIQDQVMARNEHGDPTKQVTNKQALFERKSEILKQAIRRVGRKVELELEMLRIMEDFHGGDSAEVQAKLLNMESTFMSSLKMWKLNIKMRQNNRTSFNLESQLRLMDRCIGKLVGIMVGDVLSHKPEPHTDQFLVELVVQRTKLLIQCGFVDRAIACVQAVTGFQCLNHKVNCKDSKPKDSFARLRGLFKTFWETCLPRIGDPGAKSIPNTDYVLTVSSEEKMLAQEREEIRTKEDDLIKHCKEKNLPNPEIWRMVEALRSELFWRPVRNVAVAEEYYEYDSRKVDFSVVNPVLFPILDKNLALDLVFQLLQLFGAVIPGMETNSQEEILKQFSADLFPQFVLNLHKFSDFLDNFFSLLSNVEGVDKLRVLSAKIISRIHLDIFQSDLSKNEKKRKMMALIGDVQTAPDLAHISANDKLILLYQISQRNEVVMPDGKHSKLFQFAERILFDTAYPDIWTMEDGRERLLHLKLAQFFCRRLPYSDEPGLEQDTLTKKKFLISLGVKGIARTVDYNQHNHTMAVYNWMMRTNAPKYEAPPTDQADLWWFGNEEEITLELASTFTYEVAPGGLHNKLHEFDNVFQKSKLAKAVGLSAAVLKHKFHIYKHHMQRSSEITPHLLATHLIHSMQRFPHKVSFVKNFLALRNTFNARYFLQTNPGNQKDPTDELAKRVRTCAKVFLEWKNFVQAPDGESGASALDVLRKVLEAAAAEQTNTSIPDAYLWCSLLYIEHENGSSKHLDEVFNLGQKQCPWSKQFLLESAKNRPNSSDHLTVVNNVAENAGIQLYCNPEIEVPMLLRVDVFAERSEFD